MPPINLSNTTLIMLGVYLFLIILEIISLISTINGLRRLSILLQLQFNGQNSTGKVVQILSRPMFDTDETDFTHLVVEFLDTQARPVRFTADVLGISKEGEQLKIRFLPSNPSIAQPATTTLFSSPHSIFEQLVRGILPLATATFLLAILISIYGFRLPS